jgi:hypothetical protein
MSTIKISIFFLLTFIFSYTVKGQKVIWDNLKEGNIRHIGTNRLEMNINGADYEFSLTLFSGSNYKNYCLLISSIWKIENNSILMIKLGNDETVKLISDNVNTGQVDYPKYTPIIGNSQNSGIISTQKVNYYVSIYPLESSLLNKIAHYGIKKIRIAFINTYHERSWKKDKLGKYLNKCHKKIEERLQKPVMKTSSIESGF